MVLSLYVRFVVWLELGRAVHVSLSSLFWPASKRNLFSSYRRSHTSFLQLVIHASLVVKNLASPDLSHKLFYLSDLNQFQQVRARRPSSSSCVTSHPPRRGLTSAGYRDTGACPRSKASARVLPSSSIPVARALSGRSWSRAGLAAGGLGHPCCIRLGRQCRSEAPFANTSRL